MGRTLCKFHIEWNSPFGRGWKWLCGKLWIRYKLLRSLRMWYVSLRNERIVADGLYVPSAGSVSVCVTGALPICPVLNRAWSLHQSSDLLATWVWCTINWSHSTAGIKTYSGLCISFLDIAWVSDTICHSPFKSEKTTYLDNLVF